MRTLSSLLRLPPSCSWAPLTRLISGSAASPSAVAEPVPVEDDVSPKTAAVIDREDKYGAHNYHPLPVALTRGEGVFMWDVDGKRYYDFLSAYSAVNQGSFRLRVDARLSSAFVSLRFLIRNVLRVRSLSSKDRRSFEGTGLYFDVDITGLLQQRVR